MNSDETIQHKAAATADKAQETTEGMIDDAGKEQIRRTVNQAACSASNSVNALVNSIETCTRHNPGCALLVAGFIGVCVGRHFYKK